MTAASAVALTTATTRIELAQDILRQFGFLRMHATGGSMLPAIAPGDLLTFRACTADQVDPGQVVLMRHPERLVAHRLLACQDRLFVTRGDALAAADVPMQTTALIGVLASHERGGRPMPTGGRYWLRRQRAVRWLIQRVDLAHRLLRRVPALVSLAS